VSKARSLGVTRGGEAALPDFLPFNTALSRISASLSISQLYAIMMMLNRKAWGLVLGEYGNVGYTHRMHAGINAAYSHWKP